MKSQKSGNLVRLVAFFVIAVILVSAVTLGAGGWQLFGSDDSDSGKVEDDNNTIDNTDNNINGDSTTDGEGENDESQNGDDLNNAPPDNVPVVKPIPEYLHYITGLETTEEQAYLKPICFVYDHTAPIYGLTSTYLTVEIPTESGKTRILGFSDDYTTLGKIGSLAPTRKYISDVAGMFGGVLISYGNDDSFDYTTGNTLKTEAVDFSKTSGYSYSEFTDFVYTNGDLVSALKSNGIISSVSKTRPTLPYLFTDYYAEPVKYETALSKVSIKYGDGNTTELIYNDNSGKFILSKNASLVNDMLNDKYCEYENVFVLFADSTTIETSVATQTIINTSEQGTGYYFTEGSYTKINWAVDYLGNMTFTDGEGEKLVINRGESYVCFAKSSSMNSLTIK